MAYLRYKVDETALFYDRLSNIRKSRKKRKSSPLNVCVHMRTKVLEDKLLIDAFSLPPCSFPWDQSFFGKPKEFIYTVVKKMGKGQNYEFHNIENQKEHRKT